MNHPRDERSRHDLDVDVKKAARPRVLENVKCKSVRAKDRGLGDPLSRGDPTVR